MTRSWRRSEWSVRPSALLTGSLAPCLMRLVTILCTSFQGRLAAPAAGRPGLVAGCAGCRQPAGGIGAAPRRHLAGVAGTPRSPGGSVAAPFRAGALRARRLPRAAGQHPAVTGAPPSAVGRACKNGRPSPSRRASCHRAKITVKGRGCGAALRAGASATP